MYLYHYYDKSIGPFRSLSELPVEKANSILKNIKAIKPDTQAAKRNPEYMYNRFYYEEILRTKFLEKGGKIERKVPYYMVVEHSPWLASWFENTAFIKIPVEEFDLSTISFTYGDSHPTFSPKVNDGKEYRRKVYTYEEILDIIKKYGFPQDWNNDGRFGPERYIEVHIWSDETISKYK